MDELGPVARGWEARRCYTLRYLSHKCRSISSITLNTTHPMAQPLINPNMTSDGFVLRHGIRNTLRYMNASAWRAYNITPMFEGLTEQSGDDKVDAFIRANVFGGAHVVSTASMGPASSPPGSDVVGPDFRIKGVEGLRIVDASAVPFMPNGHSMAVVYVLEEKAADIIRSGNAA
ncbi:GMC oxidoreductase-domain-containing protein [Ephemerocybe angulata]|uniref:GMC oxidoreductase-domain-containing protein n=1 Tax=Ephemerocybe angulata TaxID=980116 RepID=A0A8H6I5W3_9AGAR|nr:GMC oxidoreductase-domain-containing protein [Tulosesus angulatus]